MTVAEELLTRVLELPENERGMIVRRVLLSLEPDEPASHEEWESAWSEEIQRRREEVRSGKAELSSWSEVKTRLLSEFGSESSS